MKKIFLIISLALAAVSCDPEEVFIDADEPYEVKEVSHDLKVATYDGYDFLVFRLETYGGPPVVHSESCKCKKHE